MIDKKGYIYSKIKDFYKENYFLIIIYTLSHGWIFFLSDSIYWDDWSLFDVSPNVVIEIFNMAGYSINGHLHNTLLALGIFPYRILTFILMLISGLILKGIFKRNNYIDKNTRLILISIFLTVPLFSSRVAIINFPYVLYTFLFFVGWILLPTKRNLSFIFFFLSFNCNSLLSFYIFPFIEQYYLKNEFNFKIKNLKNFICNNILLTSLPFLYFTIKLFFFKTYSIYENYNKVFKLRGLLISPIVQLLDFIKLEAPSISLTIIIGILFYTFLTKFKVLENIIYPKKHNINLLKFGIFSFFIAGLPYWVLGLQPTFNGWESRHQLLFPLSAAFLLTSFLYSLNFKYRKLFFSIILSIFILINFSYYLSFYKDWHKQLFIMDKISKSEVLRNSDIILIKDHSSDLNMYKKHYRYIEWNGLISYALGEDKRIAVDIKDYPHDLSEMLKLLNGGCGYLYNMTDIDINKKLSIAELEINKKNIKPNSNKIYQKIENDFDFKIKETSIKDINTIIKESKLDKKYLCNPL